MLMWILVGLVCQVAMVVVGHLAPPLRDWWGPGGVLISLAVGALAAPAAQGSWPKAVANGALAGGVGAFAGILLALVLGDVPALLLALGTLSSLVSGVVGAVIVNVVRARRAGAG